METQLKSQRLQSLDALRGFDMFFLMGGDAILVALAVLFPIPFFQTIAEQTEHVAWHGLAFEDMIFPVFLFIAGISFPFSLAKQKEKGMDTAAIYKKIIRRGLTLVLLGCIYNGLLNLNFENQRYASVLGRIGLAWMFAALIFINTKAKTRVGIVALLLVGYWLLLAFCPAPDGNGDPFSMEGCLVGYIDRLFLPGKLYKGIHDPEGILGIIPAIGTASLGMLTGEWIKLKREGLSEMRKVYCLLACGAGLIVIGILWNFVFPINKNLWSSSFTCVVGGIAMILFALFYYVIDIKECRKWTLFFRVIGMNSITIYIAQHFFNFSFTNQLIFGGLASLFPETAQPLILAFGYTALTWGFLYFLYKQKIFLKV